VFSFAKKAAAFFRMSRSHLEALDALAKLLELVLLGRGEGRAGHSRLGLDLADPKHGASSP
jgi:hypothetical protein